MPAQLENTHHENMHREDIGKFILRNGIALLMLCHGIYKLVHGYAHVVRDFADAGFPAFLGHGVLVTEVAAPIAMIVGYKSRYAAATIVMAMIVAIYLVHGAGILSLNVHGGWAIELQGLFIVGALGTVFLGGGRYSLEEYLARRKVAQFQ